MGMVGAGLWVQGPGGSYKPDGLGLQGLTGVGGPHPVKAVIRQALRDFMPVELTIQDHIFHLMDLDFALSTTPGLSTRVNLLLAGTAPDQRLQHQTTFVGTKNLFLKLSSIAGEGILCQAQRPEQLIHEELTFYVTVRDAFQILQQAPGCLFQSGLI